MKIIKDFNEYKLISTSDGKKIENWNGFTLLRPDPEIIWHNDINYNNIDAIYERSNTGGGKWLIKNEKLNKPWQIKYKDYIFNLKLMNFKHTGLFPEQAYNWNYLEEIIKKSNRKDIKVLNLFAYTGASSIVALKNGCSVVHVDSSKGMIEWAKENVRSNKLEDKPIRYLQDDCLKFVKREIRRGNKYDIIMMDPPSFGRGSQGEVWNIENSLFELVKLSKELLSDKPLMFLINSYTTGLSKTVIENILNILLVNELGGKVVSDELGIKEENSSIILPCGNFARWEK